jgi:hypothetical protein
MKRKTALIGRFLLDVEDYRDYGRYERGEY